MTEIRKYITLREWNPVYTDPIVLKKGDSFKYGKEDEQWKGWIWCTKDGRGGWVPKQFIKFINEEDGEAIQNYSAVELKVERDMIVVGLKEFNGWLWVRQVLSDEEGWVPREVLKSI